MLRSRAFIIAVVAVLAVGAGIFSAWHFNWLPDWSEREEGEGPALVWHDGKGNEDSSYSNILPSDYVGPDACGKCHEDKHALWSKHPHRFMNQWATPASVKGDFSGVVWSPRTGHSVQFTHEGDDY